MTNDKKKHYVRHNQLAKRKKQNICWFNRIINTTSNIQAHIQKHTAIATNNSKSNCTFNETFNSREKAKITLHKRQINTQRKLLLANTKQANIIYTDSNAQTTE